jgi:dTDP-4-dehydrorhamnose 3,5-epimerase
MEIVQTTLNDCLLIKPDVFNDSRGFFLETFHEKKYKETFGIDFTFVQDNHSRSSYGTLRGLHFQKENPQGKLVKVSRGKVLDVAVDIRKESSTFGQSEIFELSDSNLHQVWIPPGFAHGFLVLSNIADFEYKCTDYYQPEDEQSIFWRDSDLSIPWPEDIKILISDRDASAQSFKEYCNKL